MSTAKRSFLRWLWDEFLHVLPAIIYFAIAFNLIRFTCALNLAPGAHRYFSPLELTLLALIMGKVMLVTNALPIINIFPHKPLIYSIVWKFWLYLFFVFVFWALEAMIRVTYGLDSYYAGVSSLLDDLSSPVFWACVCWIAYTLLIYVVISEYVRVIGTQRILNILLRPLPL
jgi:hypothetical protein